MFRLRTLPLRLRTLPLRLSYQRSRLHPSVLTVPRLSIIRVRCHASQVSADTPRNLFQRAQQFVRDNPYTKFSLSILAILLGLSVAMELFKRFKAKKSPAVAVYPPRVGHLTIKRNDVVEQIDNLVVQIKRQKPDFPVLFLTGDAGTGKSELAYQYAMYFASTCTKWFGLRPQTPVVLYINAMSLETLESSLKESAFGVGVQDKDLSSVANSTLEKLVSLSGALRSKLLEKKLPWLIVVDNLSEESVPGFKAVFLSNDKPDQASEEVDERVLWRDLDGVTLAFARSVDKTLPQKFVLSIPNQMYSNEGAQLFRGLSGLDLNDDDVVPLLNRLHHHPLAIAVCAATVKIYQSFIDSLPEHADSNAVKVYQEIFEVRQKSLPADILDVAVSLYLEAAVSDERFRHAFDLLGSCDLTRPLPVSIISRHLESPFYRVPKDSLAPPPIDTAIEMQKLTGINPSENASFFAQLKAMLPWGAKVPSTSELAAVMAASEDRVSYLRECPMLSFKAYRRAGFEYVQVHELFHEGLASLFTKYTVPKLNIDGLAVEEAQFNRSTWFRSYRTFDPKEALEKYHRSLPGISGAGVLTRDEFQKHPSLPNISVSLGTRPSGDSGINYLEYLQLVSHYHRVVETFSEEVKSADHDVCDTLTRRYLYPHIKHLSRYPLLSQADQVTCSYDQASIEATLSILSYENALTKFEEVLSKQKLLFGEKSQIVAHTLVDMGHLSYSTDHLQQAKSLLEASLKIYEGISSKQATQSFPLEIGVAYTSLAMVCSALGQKQLCKDLLEQALGAFQTVSPDGTVSKRQRKLVSSSLTDIAHAYISLGDVLMAKKYIDLSMLSHKNLYLESHPESVRTLNVSSIVYSLLGDKPESRKLREEAGKQQAQLDRQPLML